MSADRRRRFSCSAAVIAVALCMSGGVQAADNDTVMAVANGADLLVYTNGCVVRDHRVVNLPQRDATISIAGIPRRISTESTVVHGTSLNVGKKTFRLNTISRGALLSRYVGKEITVVRTDPATGKETREQAVLLGPGGRGASNDPLLNGNENLVLQYKDRTEVGLHGRIVLPTVPDDFVTEPTLLAEVKAKRTGKQAFDLVYLTNGIRWSVDYVVTVGDKTLDLEAQATVHNTLDHRFKLKNLSIIAGQVPFQTAVRSLQRAEAAQDTLPRSRFDEFHRYQVDGPIDLHANQVRQFTLFRADGVAYERRYVHRSRTAFATLGRGEDITREIAAIEIHFRNDKTSGLGIPMPAGTMRLFKQDKAGLNFIGAARIGDTAQNQPVELALGRAFDITVERKRLDFSREGGAGNEATATWEVRVANTKPEAVRILIEEIFSDDWEILEENIKHRKPSAGIAAWDMTVPENAERVLRFRVRVHSPKRLRTSITPLTRTPARTSN